MSLTLYNTLSRAKEEFVPNDPDRVTMYVCGPTVYSYAHIGNARPAVVFDVLVRLLRHQWPNVVFARNITDIDDKINAAAAVLDEEGCARMASVDGYVHGNFPPHLRNRCKMRNIKPWRLTL